MTNPTQHGQVPEALIDLIDAYAETRHRYDGFYNAKTEAARKAVIEALSGVQALSAAPAMGDDFRDTLVAVSAAIAERDDRAAQKMIREILAASTTPPAEQQATKETSGGFHVWRDISTAPKDGSRFVATGHNYGLYSEVRHICVAQWFRGCWVETSDWNETSELKYLTHWMPLPSPPDDVAAPAEQQAQPDECFPGEPKVAVPQGLISAACFAIRKKRDGGKVLEQLRRYSVGDRSQPLAPQQAAPKAAPVLPEGWTACTIEFGNDGPEEVAYGPQRMMNRLAKWLGKYFAQVIAEAAPKAAPGEREQAAQRLRELAGVSENDVADPLHPRYIEGYKAGHAAGRKQAAPQQEAQDATVAAFEAVRKKLCTLPRYSFVLDDDGLVRRAPDRTGNWIEFDEAHALFDPVSVDAALAAQGGAA